MFKHIQEEITAERLPDGLGEILVSNLNMWALDHSLPAKFNLVTKTKKVEAFIKQVKGDDDSYEDEESSSY